MEMGEKSRPHAVVSLVSCWTQGREGFLKAQPCAGHSHSVAVQTKDHAAAPHWGGEWEEKGQTVGRDKDRLTEQQRKKTVTTILLRRIHKTREYTEQLSHRPMPSALPSCGYPPPRQLPAPNQGDGTWCRIPRLSGHFGSASQLCPLPDSGEN